ncbi:bifunctional aldolase/short-chain dehydrogenase, partial [Thermodesulfobacteriota bacterium]
TGLDLKSFQRLIELESLSDEEMENQLRIHRIDSLSPEPSVEALLHACLPHRYVAHTHADSILILTNQVNGPELIQTALGENVIVLPYAMSGLPLAKQVVAAYQKYSQAEAIVIVNHGIFTFADTAITAYHNMIDYVDRASAFIDDRIREKPLPTVRSDETLPTLSDSEIARCIQVVRGACAHREEDGRMVRFYIEIRNAPDLVTASVSSQAALLCRTGVLTPDHAIRTKNSMAFIESIPEDEKRLKQIVHTTMEAFGHDYHQYFRNQTKTKTEQPEMLDSVPRLFLIGGLGLIALGATRKAARIAADIGEHTIRAKLRAFDLGDYLPISETHVFDMEYWRLQQKKLEASPMLLLGGQTAVVTGGGGAIGFGVAKQLLAAGAVVFLADIDQSRLEHVYHILAPIYGSDRVERITFDVTDFKAVQNAYEDISRKVGGFDIVVPNAGVAHVATIENLEPNRLDQVLSVNLKGTFNVIKAAIPIFKRQGSGGNIVVISSKNVFDPGASFSAYSASKAGAHQLSKIAAMELAEWGVRVNMVNPDAVFGDHNVSSQLWDIVGPERMKSRGLDADGLKAYYRERSLLKVPVLPEHVGNAVVFFAGEKTPTTGASLPVDAGVASAFPR